MIKDQQEDNQKHLAVNWEICDYRVQDAECLLDKPLTKWFCYQTQYIWVGIVLAAFPNVIRMGVGGE